MCSDREQATISVARLMHIHIAKHSSLLFIYGVVVQFAPGGGGGSCPAMMMITVQEATNNREISRLPVRDGQVDAFVRRNTACLQLIQLYVEHTHTQTTNYTGIVYNI